MIFAAWFSLWLILSTNIWMLMIPAMALVVRGSYTERRVQLRGFFLMIAGIVFLFFLISQSPYLSFVWAIRTLLFLLLLEHLLRSMQSSTLRVPFLQYHVANTLHMMTRVARLVSERAKEITYASGFRRPQGETSLRRFMYWAKSQLAVAQAAGLEFVQLKTQLEDVVHARGELPHPRDWQEVTHFRTLLFLGDLSLLGATTCAVFLPQSWLFPEGLVSLSSVLSEWIFRTLANGLGG